MVSAVAGPTSANVDPFTGATALTYQVNSNGAAPLLNFRNATTVNVNGTSGPDVLTENLLTRFDAGSPNQLTTLQLDSRGATDEIDILATPAGVTTFTNTNLGVPDNTVIGATVATFHTGVGDLHNIKGPVNVTDSGGIGELFVDDSGASSTETPSRSRRRALRTHLPPRSTTTAQWRRCKLPSPRTEAS